MTAALAAYIEERQARINRLIGRQTGITTPEALKSLGEASQYSLLNGGKRVRPLLAYAAADATGNPLSEQGLDHAALALELLHTYSLIHDDLPAMDDDDMRRGKPSLHRAYDEATAILVGDGLQAQAFDLLACAPGLSDVQKVKLIRVMAKAVGPTGMVGGQYIDILATNSAMDLDGLRSMHLLKTGALIRAALTMGGITANASTLQLKALDAYGESIGLAFQVVDDILDVEGNSDILGKTQGKDEAANKPTYVKLMGLAGAKAEADRLLAEALAQLEPFDTSADPLRDLANYIVTRER